MNDKAENISWLKQEDRLIFMESDTIPTPWFPAFKSIKSDREQTRWFSAFVPIAAIPKLLENSHGWDIGPTDGLPSVWTHYDRGEVTERRYCAYGNEEVIEPLVIHRSFHGMRQDYLELAQEFRFYHNLFHERAHARFLKFNRNGDEFEAARYGEDFLEVRTDLLRRFCAVKQVALGVYLESFRYSEMTLQQIGLAETREEWKGERHHFRLAIVPEERSLRRSGFETCSLIVGAKKYVLPEPMPPDDEADGEREAYQEFIIGEDDAGNTVRYSCDPSLLADSFGKNPNAPHYLTPVFFRPEVLGKYYQQPDKYSVEDGYLRCGSLWGVRIDNDHSDCVMVFLGDLGRDLSEEERNYWLSFNIPREGRVMSQTTFKRSFMAEFADPARPDLAFKHAYICFCEEHRNAQGWDFFLPLHSDDAHYLTALHLPANDNQADFDGQLLALTKLLVDSLNEKMIAKDVATVASGDKGITKLEKFLISRGLPDPASHIAFLRSLQDLRSRSAAHRKGSAYDQLVATLKIKDEGQKLVFGNLLLAAQAFVKYLYLHLCRPLTPTPDISEDAPDTAE